MRTNKIVLAISLLAASNLATAAGSETFTPSAQMGDAIIVQTSISTGVQLSVSIETGNGIATLSNPNTIGPYSNGVRPVAEIGDLSAQLPIPVPKTTVSAVDPYAEVNGKGTATALVTQDVNAVLVLPISAVSAIAGLVSN
jgi:hypothetical protein